MKNKYLSFCLIVLLFITPGFSKGSPAVISYDADTGLSHNTVRCVIQDSCGFMWFGTSEGINRFDGTAYKFYYPEDTDSTLTGSNSIHSLFVDTQGVLWMGSSCGLYRYDLSGDHFLRLNTQTPFGVVIGSQVNRIRQDISGKIWIATQGQGIFVYDIANDSLKQINRYSSIISTLEITPRGRIFAGTELGSIIELDETGNFVKEFNPGISGVAGVITEIKCLFADRGKIWSANKSGSLGTFDISSDAEAPFYREYLRHTYTVRAIFPYRDDILLLGTDNGPVIMDKRKGIVCGSGDFDPVKHAVNDIYRDGEGGLWIATEYGGVYHFPQTLKIFEHRLGAGSKEQGTVVNCFAEDSRGNIWVGTRDKGLLVFSGASGKRIDSGLDIAKSLRDIRSIMIEGELALVGTFNDGLYIIDILSGIYKHHRYERGNPNTLSDNTVYAVYKDSGGNIYVGTRWGLHRYDQSENDFNRESRADNQPYISQIIQDSRGNIWFASYTQGIFRYFPEEETWSHLTRSSGKNRSLPSNRVICMMEDTRGLIWMSTEGGLCYFDYETGDIRSFDQDHSLLKNTLVYSMEADGNGYLWVSGNNGIECIDPVNNISVNHFSHTDGLQGNQFSHRASLRSSSGKLFFGGINGFNAFDPGNFGINGYIPKVVLTAFYINGREVRVSTPDAPTPLNENIAVAEKVKLKNNQNSIGLDFVALSFQNSAQNKYLYTLEGWDDDWIDSGTHNRATYNNLRPGKYRFIVKGSNNDGIWGRSESALEVEILPPFYRTWWAFFVYMGLFLTAVWTAVIYQRRINDKRLEQYAIAQEKKTYQSKIDFFTNLAHEIRTPLTLIKVPLENVLTNGVVDMKSRNLLNVMDRNAGNLLNLVNQLLDFRKSEEDAYKPVIRQCDISSLMKEVCGRFIPVMQINGIRMELNMPGEDIRYNIDSEAFLKIMNNLLSNASKYAGTLVTVTLEVEDQMVVKVGDDGPGIAGNERENIFNAFYQASGSESGTGIGLPLAKLLTEKHGGKIWVEENPGGGSLFVVSIPRLESTGVAQGEKNPMVVGGIVYQESKRRANPLDKETVVLIVEDNPDMRRMIEEIVAIHYSVKTAENGKEALEVLEREDVHIIVSDLMMPQMDGYQLCEYVKSDMRYSHIPIIQLTARTTMEDRLKGLEYGSDAYIEKPFSTEHLLKQIKNLIENRRRLRESYKNAILTSKPVPSGSSRKDNEFIDKVNEYILENLGNPDFYIDSLTDKLYMSRSSFYRKIKSLFGMSPNEYLKRVRLEKARELLLHGEHIASEVYLMVGFNSLSYFSTCFKSYFGKSPKEYVADCTAGGR